MKTVRVTIEVDGGDGVSAELPAEDVQQALIFAGMEKCDDGEWTWDMQEQHPERLDAIQKFIYAANSLIVATEEEA